MRTLDKKSTGIDLTADWAALDPGGRIFAVPLVTVLSLILATMIGYSI